MRRLPRVSTRGFYDLHTGKAVNPKPYRVYPRYFFDDLDGGEIAVMLHGMRNRPPGALKKFEIAAITLARCRYRHPVVGFTYDADVRARDQELRVAQKIAVRNGKNLARFVADVRAKGVRVRLLGHSLGSVVAVSAVRRLALRKDGRGSLESVHFFGGSVEADDARAARADLRRVVRTRVTNVYAPSDPVLGEALELGQLRAPVGLAACSPYKGWTDRMSRPAGHRFAEYAQVLSRFP